MTLVEAVKLAIAAEDAYDPDKGGPSYLLIDKAAFECAAVLKRRPNATGPLVGAAQRFVDWQIDDLTNDASDGRSWARYDTIMQDCRKAIGET